MKRKKWVILRRLGEKREARRSVTRDGGVRMSPEEWRDTPGDPTRGNNWYPIVDASLSEGYKKEKSWLAALRVPWSRPGYMQNREKPQGRNKPARG